MNLINRLQPGREAVDEDRGIIINAAASTFTSLAILDALKMFEGPIIELHISDTHRREGMYRHSLVSKAATSVIAGLGAKAIRRRLIESGEPWAPSGCALASVQGVW